MIIFSKMEYPPSWDVFSIDEFLGYTVDSNMDNFGASLLVQMTPDAAVSDYFRIHIFGGHLLAHFAVSRIIDIPEARGVFALLHCPASDAQPSINRTATVFMDFQAAVQEGTVILTDANQQVIPAQEFREKLFNSDGSQPPIGASLRWAVGVSATRTSELALQALPVPKGCLLPGHNADNIATVCILTIPLPMSLGDDTSYEGPIPIIFSPDPMATLSALHSDPGKAKKELHRVVQHFYIMEYITLREAKDYVKKLRAPHGRPAYHNIPDDLDPAPNASVRLERISLHPDPERPVLQVDTNRPGSIQSQQCCKHFANSFHLIVSLCYLCI